MPRFVRSLLPLCLLVSVSAHAQEIFHDDFESGDLCAWSSSTGAALPYAESFDLADGSPWPSPWAETGNVALADVQGGMARFRPGATGYSLGRLDAPIATRDVEVELTIVFEDVGTQGVGFYVRQNGGYLDETVPAGEGYAVFVEGFRGPGIGVWREVGGVESPIHILFDASLGFQDGVPYRVRFHVSQDTPSQTRLQAKVWPVADAEPPAWHVDVVDPTAQLQGLTGGIVLDSWSSLQSPNPITDHTLVDDVIVRELCPEP